MGSVSEMADTIWNATLDVFVALRLCAPFLTTTLKINALNFELTWNGIFCFVAGPVIKMEWRKYVEIKIDFT